MPPSLGGLFFLTSALPLAISKRGNAHAIMIFNLN